MRICNFDVPDFRKLVRHIRHPHNRVTPRKSPVQKLGQLRISSAVMHFEFVSKTGQCACELSDVRRRPASPLPPITAHNSDPEYFFLHHTSRLKYFFMKVNTRG